MTVAGATSCVLAWALVPVVFGPLFELLMGQSAADRRAYRERAADVYATMSRTRPSVWLLEVVVRAAGFSGPLIRLIFWPLWFVQMWLVVEDQGAHGP